MNDRDDHVIPYEEAVRRHRALEEQKRKGIIREVKISDAMSHLLEEQEAQPDEHGSTPAHLRSIVEREFSEEEAQGTTGTERAQARCTARSPGRASRRRADGGRMP